ncbi:MAG: autorepressor SdpR family transcription factor [Bacteroidota bacterium]
MKHLFYALNDPTRRAILDLLRDGSRTAGEIADAFAATKPTISHHLRVLAQADLVTAEKDGRYLIYSLQTTVLEEAIQWLLALRRSEEAASRSTS